MLSQKPVTEALVYSGQWSVYSNVQYILVPICVLYSVQYSVQYILELRVRNNLHEAGGRGVIFQEKMWCRKLFFLCIASAFCVAQWAVQ